MISRNVFDLSWTFGVNVNSSNKSLHCINSRLFYPSGINGVLYDPKTNHQEFLRGHCNEITSIDVSSNQRWLLSADSGENSIIIVWDTQAEKDQIIPIKILNEPHRGGVVTALFSKDSKYIYTLGNDSPQSIMVWDWTSETETPIHQFTIPEGTQIQTSLIFKMDSDEAFMTFGQSTTYFYLLDKETGISMHSPNKNEKILDYAFENVVGALYLSHDEKTVGVTALSVLKTGQIVFWQNRDFKDLQQCLPPGQMTALQCTRVQDSLITFITQVKLKNKTIIVTGAANGSVHVYDEEMHLLWYYEVANALDIPLCGTISDIAFDLSEKEFPDMYFLTSTGQLIFLQNTDFSILNKTDNISNTKKPKRNLKNEFYETIDLASYEMKIQATPIVDFPFERISGIRVHPNHPFLYVCGETGFLHIWDYEKKQKIYSVAATLPKADKNAHKKDSSARCPISAIAINKTGDSIAIALRDSRMVYKFYDASTLKLQQTLFQYEQETPEHLEVNMMEFSPCGTYLAAVDSNNATIVFRKRNQTWEFLGKSRVHTDTVIYIGFMHKFLQENGIVKTDPNPTLITISRDTNIVHYDVMSSSIETGLKVQKIKRIEQYYIPTAAAFYEEEGRASQPKLHLLLANTDFKIRTINGDTTFVRKTTLGPGSLYGLLNRMTVIHANSKHYLAFTTERNVLGLVKLPLDGNLYHSTGMIVHSAGINDIVASKDGKYLFTTSKNLIHQWNLDMNEFEKQVGQLTPDPFLEILESEPTTELSRYREMENYFYFTQIKNQGEKTTKEYKISSQIPLSNIPDVMRAMGFYPTDEQIENMINEVKFSEVDDTGRIVTEIDMEHLVRLYVNHKPTFDPAQLDYEIAVQKLTNTVNETQLEDGTTEKEEKFLKLMNSLGEHGESLDHGEFSIISERMKISNVEDLIALAAQLP